MNDSNPDFLTYTPPTLVRALLWLSHRSFIGRGKWRDGVYAIIKTMHDKPVDMHFWGAPIRIDPRTNPLERGPMLRYDRVDRHERTVMHSFLDHPGSVFVDLGSNMGLYTFDAAINGPEATRVVAVEANPSMAARLQFNIATMQQANIRNASNIKLFPVAVGAKNGVAPMQVTGPEHLASLFEPKGDTVDVPVQTLLELLADAKINQIDYLKIDVEGYEGEALGPFIEKAPESLLPRCIQIEHNASEIWSCDLFALMKNRSYTEMNRVGMNAFWSRIKNT